MMKFNSFQKLVFWIVAMLIPILILHSYTNRVSIRVVENEIQSATLNRLNFFASQLETTIDQLALNSITLMSDPDFALLKNLDMMKDSERASMIKKTDEKLRLQIVASNWDPKIMLVFPQSGLSIPYGSPIDSASDDAADATWRYRQSDTGNHYEFSISIADPLKNIYNSDKGFIMTTTFSSTNLVRMLDEFKSKSRGDPFLYEANAGIIPNSTSAAPLVAELAQLLRGQELASSGNQIVTLQGNRYSLFYVRSNNLGWQVVDYMPLETIIAPIQANQKLFYFSVAILLIGNIILVAALYRNIRLPLKQLLRSFQKMKTGDYTTRIITDRHTEFGIVHIQFNQMAEQIQALIENVYQEQLRSRESHLKQLQAQINPHFLYNCLNFVHVMNQRGDKDAVSAMILNLGSYYRYTTRLEEQAATLEEELSLIENYLTIQSLRMRRLHYELDVPASMRTTRIPRLTLQPVVENAVIHGVDRKPGPCVIMITGVEEERHYAIVVEDSGIGMDKEGISGMNERLRLKKPHASMGLGVWNVHQRLSHLFKGDSGLTVVASPLGGLRVVIRWNKEKEASAHASSAYRG
ncbi:sensor histidine kinase [Paenibacillus sp. PAMC21692]|uniref:cache domain-containing sensor histidine kinase n=1 Tax=Paenibacillus sp. PAMC21692 TaxID=2762320 RepID=UPI00164D33CC|nr:histidine kinase [Paenibacillus sp. PAMC21692]QNK57253.1 sensor histidine kinase [Paenibacillus sp. PAMC21692]